MSATVYGTVIAAPDGDGFGVVAFGDAQRRCWFQPERFAAPWPVPQIGDTVAVVPGTPQHMALHIIKRGAPTYQYTDTGGG